MAYRSKQIGDFLGVSAITVTRYAQTGELKGKKSENGRQWEFNKEDIAQFIIWHDRSLNRFFAYRPTKQTQISYDILRKEVLRLLQKYT